MSEATEQTSMTQQEAVDVLQVAAPAPLPAPAPAPATQESLLAHVRRRLQNAANELGIEVEHVRNFFVTHV